MFYSRILLQYLNGHKNKDVINKLDIICVVFTIYPFIKTKNKYKI